MQFRRQEKKKKKKGTKGWWEGERDMQSYWLIKKRGQIDEKKKDGNAIKLSTVQRCKDTRGIIYIIYSVWYHDSQFRDTGRVFRAPCACLCSDNKLTLCAVAPPRMHPQPGRAFPPRRCVSEHICRRRQHGEGHKAHELLRQMEKTRSGHTAATYGSNAGTRAWWTDSHALRPENK